jgi:putative transposase
MRGLVNFEVGEIVTLDGRDMRFDGLVPPMERRSDDTYDLQFLDARNRRAENFTPDEFLALYADGRVLLHRSPEKRGDVGGDDESSSRRIARRWRLFWTQTYDNAPVPKSTDKLQGFIQAHLSKQPDPVDPPSPHTLRRWLRERGRQGDRRPKQMGDRRRRKSGRLPVHELVQSAYEAASNKYWSNYKVTFEDVQIEVRAAIFAENRRRKANDLPLLRVPGRTTLWRWLRFERTYDNVLTREGRHVADRLFKGIRNSLSAKRIMDVAIIDHKRMDIHVCDSTRRIAIGRPWLAVLIDVKSRMVLGYTLSFEDPSVLSAMACVRAAMRGRPDIKERFPTVDGEWEAFGMPRTILADNAWENTGSSFADACADNGISIEWAPIKRPEYKGILERFFSRLDDQLAHKLPGAVVDHPYALAQRRIDPQSDASLTLAELDELVCRYLVDVYSCDLHTGIKDAPLRVWRESAARDGIELAHDLAAVEHAMGKLVRDRMLNHAGVTFQNLTYRSAAIDGLLADLLPLQAANVRPGSARVKIKYHPEDLSRIFVWNELRNIYVALPCTEENYARGLSERVHNEIQRHSRGEVEDWVGEEERCRRKAALLKTIQESYDDQPLKERRRRARMLSDGAVAATDSTIFVDSVSNRVGGDRPEKAAVRSRVSKPSAQTPQIGEIEELAYSDPFADRDRQAAIEQSLKRLA